MGNLKSWIILNCMSFDWGRKPENPEGTHADTRRWHKEPLHSSFLSNITIQLFGPTHTDLYQILYKHHGYDVYTDPKQKPYINYGSILSPFLVPSLNPHRLLVVMWAAGEQITSWRLCFGTLLGRSHTLALICSCKMAYCVTKHPQKYNYKAIMLHYIKANPVCNWSWTRKPTAKQAFQSLSQQ